MRIRDDLLRRARKRAADEGRSLTSLIEDALTLVMATPKSDQLEKIDLPISNASGGVLPGIDLNRSADMEEIMNGR
ncbi:MAG: hypothetical protein LJE91_16495 [Gammaproteobacteria bacterium]|nr:hypothetical protein [Gammaproteobacteria bacterium]